MAFPSDRWDIMAFFYDDESDTTTASTASTPSTSTQVLLYGEGGISKGQHYSHFHWIGFSQMERAKRNQKFAF